MNQLEIEYKTLLTPREFQRLLANFPEKATKQTNYYIDTPDRLIKQNRMSLRLRLFSDKGELTLKIPQAIGNMEYNQHLDYQTCQTLLNRFVLPHGSILTLLKERNIPLSDLGIWGELTTYRRECQTPIGLMALDKNTYAGKTDYELEIEVSHAERGKKAFERYLKDQKITFKYASSKVARCAATLK